MTDMNKGNLRKTPEKSVSQGLSLDISGPYCREIIRIIGEKNEKGIYFGIFVSVLFFSVFF